MMFLRHSSLEDDIICSVSRLALSLDYSMDIKNEIVLPYGTAL